MPQARWLARLRKQWRRMRLVVLIVGLVLMLCVWMAFQHKPGWYAPLRLDQNGRRLARQSATRRADEFGDAIVRREPFELVLREDEVNRWLVATPALWPHGESVAFRDPAVHFEPGLIRIGVLVDRGGWLAILNTGVRCVLSDDLGTVTVRLVEMAAGAVPIPRSALAWMLPATRVTPSSGQEPRTTQKSLLPPIRSVDDLLDGVHRRNRFVWPNGERAFSIDTISVEPGLIRLRIRPL